MKTFLVRYIRELLKVVYSGKWFPKGSPICATCFQKCFSNWFGELVCVQSGIQMWSWKCLTTNQFLLHFVIMFDLQPVSLSLFANCWILSSLPVFVQKVFQNCWILSSLPVFVQKAFQIWMSKGSQKANLTFRWLMAATHVRRRKCFPNGFTNLVFIRVPKRERTFRWFMAATYNQLGCGLCHWRHVT